MAARFPIRGGLIPALALALLVAAGGAGAGEQWTLERTVLVMRHGIRPPTKPQVLPQGVTRRAWPSWDVPWGHLTTHGAKAVTRLGEADRARYSGLVGEGCPDGHTLRVVADTDERTLSTASAWAAGFLPGCDVPVEHVADGQSDTRFSPYDNDDPRDGDAMLASAQAALPKGGLKAVDAANHDRLVKLSKLLGCDGPAACDLAAQPTEFVVDKGRVKIDGGVDTGSTAGQVLMLEYTDGKPMSEVGWGEVGANEKEARATIRDLLSLHALEFQLVARPPLPSRYGARVLMEEVRRGLFATDTAKLTLLVGHDSNLAYVGGALGLHWQGGDFPRDDIPPGGAIAFEKWRSDGGREVVTVRFRAQTLDEMRNLSPVGEGASKLLPLPGCGNRTACTAAAFKAQLDKVVEK